MKKIFRNLLININNDKRWIILFIIFIVLVFTRFYQIDTKSIFKVDQLENAWAVKQILVDHNFPLVGPSNKIGSGIYIGPLYFYLLSIFYFFTNLDPIAAGLFSGVTAIIGFFVLFYVTKKLFSFNTALIAVFMNTFSYWGIDFDRTPWEVNFIPIISVAVFYFLNKILNGEEKNILWLAIALALAFHIHLTAAVFLPIIVILILPFFPKTKKTVLYFLYSLPVFLLGIAPSIIANLQKNNFYIINAFNYADSSFHGLHLTRMGQLFHTVFIQIEAYTILPFLRFIAFISIPIFFVVHFLNTPSKKRFIMAALVILWFLIPWVVLSTYSGEITNYYFSTNRFVGLIVIAYLIEKLLNAKNAFITVFIFILAFIYAYAGIEKFMRVRTVGIRNYKVVVSDYIKEGKVVPFDKENPLSYIYYIYTRKNKPF